MATKPAHMELPVLNVPGEINFLMQCGLIRDKVNIDIVDLNLKTLKDTAVNFIDRKVSSTVFLLFAPQLFGFNTFFNFHKIVYFARRRDLPVDSTGRTLPFDCTEWFDRFRPISHFA